MGNKKCFCIIRDNTFYFKTNEGNSICQHTFDSIESVPGVYSFLNIFDELKVNAENLKKSMIKNNLLNKSSLLRKNFLKEIFIAVPDDVQMVEKKFLEEFFSTMFGILLKVHFTFENALVTSEEKKYICIYKTCRMFVISYICNNEIKNQLLLERKEYSEKDLQGFVNNIQPDVTDGALKLYLVGEEMEKYSSIGQVISHERLLENFVQINT